MSIEIAYELSKDTYPEITIGVHGTTIDNGIFGVDTVTPRKIYVEINNQATLIDIKTLVDCYLKHNPA